MTFSDKQTQAVFAALDCLEIELPSWGFADTGTRFGKFFQDAAASTTEEKFHDAGLVHRLTGCCPTVAVHVLWDFQLPDDSVKGTARAKELTLAAKATAKLAQAQGIRIGAINPNIFQDQLYKFGSFCSPWKEARQKALQHSLDSVVIGQAVKSTCLAMWLADGTNYPGQDSILRRKHDLQKSLKTLHDALPKNMTMVLEYKPFEPGFYHTDIADWGMSYAFCRHAGKQCKVLVDTGHHLPATNIEHIVAFLLDENMLGGFHFNDRQYADDDLTLGSIDPYAVFRIFDQIQQYRFDTGKRPSIAYMIDQSHNLKPKLQAMVQTVMTAQDLYAKAALVDRAALAKAQQDADIVAAEMCLRQAYESDIRPLLAQWRKKQGLPVDPLKELRDSGIIGQLGQQRAKARLARGQTQSSSYA